MTDKRIIFMSRDKQVSRWFVSRDNTILESGDAQNAGDLAQWHQLYTEVILVGQDVTVNTVIVPGSNNKQRLKAAPYAMEEFLASDVDDMHFAFRLEKGSQDILAAAIETDEFELYLDTLASLSISADRIIPLAGLLDTPQDCVSVLQLDDHLVINDGSARWVTDANTAQIQLKMLEGKKPNLLYWGPEDAPDWVQELSFDSHFEKMIDPWQAILLRLEPSVLNLLTAKYVQKGDLLTLPTAWRKTLKIAAALLVLHLLYMTIELVYLSQARDNLKQEVTTLYQQVSPGARVVDARRQMQQLLQQRQGAALSDGSFALMLQSLTESLQQREGVQPTNLNYSAQNTELRVDLLADNLSQFDALKQQLEKTGYQVAMGGASAQGQQYSGRIVMRSE